jgi:excisionase family DNA binding protein
MYEREPEGHRGAAVELVTGPRDDGEPGPRRLLTTFDVAALVGCHDETVRRAYLCGELRRLRFGVRSCRFAPADVIDWIARGAPTRIDSERHKPPRRMGRCGGRRKGSADGCPQDLQAERLPW